LTLNKGFSGVKQKFRNFILELFSLSLFSTAKKVTKNAAADEKIAKNQFITLKEMNSPDKKCRDQTHFFLTLHSLIFLTHFF